MARKQTQQRIGAVAMAVLLMVTAFAAVPLAMAANDPVPGDEKISVSDNVDVWQRSAFPLRADSSTAAYKIRNAQWSVVNEDGEQKILNKPFLGVYNEDEQMSLRFDISNTNRDDDEWSNENVHLVAARMSPDVSAEDAPDNASNWNSSDVMSLLTQENVNSNVTFQSVEETSLDADGVATFDFTPGQSGQYVFFLSLESESGGLQVDDGNVSVDGHSTIVGVEQTLVHDKESDVSTPFEDQTYVSSGTGENLFFDVNANGMDGENVTHTILVYDEETGFTEQEFTLNVHGDVDDRSDIGDNVTLESSVTRLRGVARTNGDDMMVDNESASPSIQNFVNALHADTGMVPDMEYEATKGGRVLDGSMTTYYGGAHETIQVEMDENWAKTNYRWVHVAVGEDGEVQTSTGEFDLPIDNRDDDSPDNPGDNPGEKPDVPGGAPPVGGTGSPSNPPSTLTDVSSSNGHATVTITNVYAGQPVDVHFTSGQVATGAFEMKGIEILPNSDMGGFDLTVTPLDSAPDGVPSVETRMGAESLSYFRIDHTISNDDVDGVTYTFSVEKSALNGQNPNNVVLYRYHDGNWNTVTTKLVGQSGSSYTYESDSPGLSVYAIGVQQSDINVDNAELEQSTIAPGDTAKVSVTVSNTGEGKGTETLELTANGNALSETQITLGAGEIKTITLTQKFDDAGEYDIAVNGESAGTLSVQNAANPDDDDGSDDTTQPTETPDDEQKGGIGGAAWVLLAIVLIAIGAGAVYYVREQQ